jgi:hypothetical protein
MIKFNNALLQATDCLIDVFEQLYPNKDAIINYTEEIKEDTDGESFLAYTLFPYDGSTPEIYICLQAPLESLPELIAHELAHVVTGNDHDHDDDWDMVFGRIYSLYIMKNTLDIMDLDGK